MKAPLKVWLGLISLFNLLAISPAFSQTNNLVSVVDLLVVYTPAARLGAGGTQPLQAQIQAAVREANLVLQNSRVNARVRLARAGEVACEESGSVSNDLARLRDGKDGFLDDVHALRDQVAADLVCLVTETGTDWDFYGLQGPSAANAFSVLRRPGLIGYWYLPVVLSFNFGCQLERPYADSVGAFPYAYGYSSTDAYGMLFSTVEAFSGSRLPFFSNPEIQHEGVPCGVPAGWPNAANNAQVLNLTAPLVAAFRGQALQTLPPIIALLNPPDGSVMFDSTNLVLLADASDSDGRVTRVEFFDGQASLAVVTQPPFQWVWAHPPPGQHIVSAMATDDDEAVSCSGMAIITVNPAPPINDNFASRTGLAGSNITVTQANNLATRETAEPAHGNVEYGHSLWWTWTPPADGLMEINTSGSTCNTVLAVYEGSELANLTTVAANYWWNDSVVTFPAQAGHAYQIVVAGYYQQAGLVALNLHLAQTPPNDDFTQRTPLIGNSVLAEGTMRHATTEPGEVGLGSPAQGHSVWWTWTAPDTGRLALEAKSLAGDALAIGCFTGNSVSNLARIGASSWDSSITVPVRKGMTLQIAVDNVPAGARPPLPGPLTLQLDFTPGTWNDYFADRTPIEGTWISLTNSNLGSGKEPDESNHGGSNWGNSIWWTWTAPRSGNVSLRSSTGHWFGVYTGASLSDLVEVAGGLTPVFTAEAGITYAIAASGPWGDAALTLALTSLKFTSPTHGAKFATGSEIPIRLTADPLEGPFTKLEVFEGNSSIAILGNTPCEFFWTNATPGEHTLGAWALDDAGRIKGMPSVSFAVGPPNDDFADTAILSGTNLEVFSSSAGATREPDEPLDSDLPAAMTLWWQWTAPTNGVANIVTTGSDGYSGPFVFFWAYAGNSLTNLTLLSTVERQWWGIGNKGAFFARAGETYHLALAGYGWSGDMGFSLSFSATPAPMNDAFANAIALSGYGASLRGYNTNATIEPGEPVLSANATGQSVWWTWTAPADGEVKLFPVGTNDNQVIGVLVGETLTNLTLLASSAGPAPLVFIAQAGQTYHLAVDGTAGDFGGIALNLVMPPANDDFARATELSGTNVVLGGAENIYLATSEINEPHLAAGATIWHTWTAPVSGKATLRHIGFEYLLWMGVFTGEELNSLTSVATSSTLPLEFEAQSGVRYHLVMDPWFIGGPAPDLEVALDLDTHLVSFTWPTNGQVVAAPEFNLEAAVHPDFGAVGEVEFFYANGTSIGRVKEPPFVVSLRKTTGTKYGFYAVARSADGRQTVSLPITISLRYPEFSNDLFVNRTRVEGTNIVVSGSNRNATTEPDEPTLPFGAVAHSVWWTWTAPANGGLRLSTWESSFITKLRVFTGESLTNLVLVPGGAGTDALAIPVLGGVIYQIALDTGGGAGADTIFVWRWEPAPTNDNFAHATVLEGVNLDVAGTTFGATGEPGERLHSGVTNLHSVWWRWTAPLNGGAEIVQLKPFWVYTGSSLTNLELVVENGPSDVRRERTFRVAAGKTYYIAMNDLPGFDSQVQFRMSAAPTPENDDFSNRIEVTGTNLTSHGTTSGATRQPGEPSLMSWAARSIWWTWTAPTNGPVEINTAGSDSTVLLGVYSGQTYSSLREPSGLIWVYPSAIRFNATAEASYHIMADQYYRVANVVLNIRAIPPPLNDNFSNRTLLVGSSLAVPAQNYLATIEGGEPRMPDTRGGSSVWWTWTAPASGLLTLTLSNAAFSQPPVFSLYTGDSLGNLVAQPNLPLDWSDLNSRSFWIAEGINYQIRLATYPGDGAEFTLRLTAPSAPPRPPNDLFINRATLAGTYAFQIGDTREATPEPGEPAHAGAPASHSVWWSWTAPAGGRVGIVLDRGTNAGLRRVAVYAGDSLAGLVPVPAGNYSTMPVDTRGFYADEAFSFEAAGGATYQIAVDGPSGGGPPFALEIKLARARITAPAEGTVFYCPTNLILNVEVASLDSLVTQVVFRVVGWGGERFSGVAANAPFSLVWTNTSPGTWAAVAVATDTNGHQSVSAPTWFMGKVRNEDFDTPAILSGIHSDIIGSSLISIHPDGGIPFFGTTVWWSWTAPADGMVTITNTRSDLAACPMVNVYVGDSLTNLILVATNHYPATDEFGIPRLEIGTTSSFGFWVAAGSTYHIAVNSLLWIPEDFQLRLQLAKAFLSNSPNESTSASPTNLWLQATPIDLEGIVQQVDFFAGTNFLGSATNRPFKLLWTNVSAGDYTLTVRAVDQFGAQTVSWPVELRLRWENDDFANRILLTGTELVVSGNNAEATSEPGEEAIGGWPQMSSDVICWDCPVPSFAAHKSLWWTWTAPGDGLLTLEVPAGGSGPLLSVLSGGTITNLTRLAHNGFARCNWCAGCTKGTRERILLAVTNGQVCQITMDVTDPGLAGEHAFRFHFQVSPANDAFANRQILEGASILVPVANWAAGGEPNEPNPAGNANVRSVWFSWTAPQSGRVTITASAPPAPVRPAVSEDVIVITLDPCGWTSDDPPLASPLTPFFAAYSGNNLGDLAPLSTGSEARFDVVAGQTYAIAVDGAGGTMGEAWMQLSLAPSPPNDDFTHRLVVQGIAPVLVGSNVGATWEPGEPLLDGASQGRSVWWSWTAPASGTVKIGDAGSFFLGVFAGSSVSDLLSIAAGYAMVEFYAHAGTTYHIAVADAYQSEDAIHAPFSGLSAAPALTSGSGVHLLEGRFEVAVVGVAGQSYAVQASTNLIDWETIAIDTLQGQSALFTAEDTAQFPYRFFRVVPLEALFSPSGLTVRLASPDVSGGAMVQVSGPAGQPFRLRASSDLTHWQDIHIGWIIGDYVDALDAEASRYPARFYQAAPWP